MPARTVALKVHALLSVRPHLIPSITVSCCQDYPDLVHDFNTFLPIEERSLREHLPHSKSVRILFCSLSISHLREMLTSVENRLVAMNMLSSQVAPIQSGSKVQSRDIRRDENAQMRPTDLIECKQGGIDSMPKQISRESLALARHRSSTAMSTSPEQQLSSLPQFKAVQAAHMLRPRNGGFQVERRVLYEQLNAMGNNNNGAMYPSHLRANQHASAACTLPPLPARVPQYLPPSHSLHPAPAPPNTVHRPWPRSGGPPTPQGAVHLEIPRSLHTRGSPTTTASTSGGSFRGRQVVGAHGEFPSNAQGGPNSAYAQSLMRNHLMAHDGAVATGSSGGGLEANHFHRLAGVRGSPSVISHGATVDCRGSVMSDTTRSGVAERAYPMPHSHIDHASGSVAAKGSANEQGLSGQQLPLPTRGECGPIRRPPRAPRAQRALAPAAAGATRLASEMLIRPVPSGNQRKALGRERKQSADGVRDTRSIGPSSPSSPLSRSKQPCRVPDDRVPHSTGPSAELRLRQVSAYHDACSFKQPIGDDKSHATAFDGTSVVDTSLSSSKQAKMETPPSSSLEDKHRIAPGIFWASDDEVDEFEDLEQGGFGGSERKIDQNEPEYEDDFFPSTSRTWSQDNISNGEEEASDAEMEIVEESASMARDASLHPDLGIPESGLATDKKFQNVDTCRAQLDKYVSYGALQKPKSGNAQKDTFAYSSNQMDMRGASAIKKVSAPPSKPRFLADSATMHKPLAHESGAASHSALTRHDSAQPYSALTRYTKSATQPVPASHAGTATQSGLKCLASATVQPSLTRRARAAPQPSLA